MSLACLHFQEPTNDWDKALAESGMDLVKFITSYEAHERARAVRPGIVFVGRHWVPDTGRWFDMAANGQADAAMDEYIDMWIDSAIANELTAFEGLNEEYDANNDTKTYLAIVLDRAFVRRLKVRAPQIKPVVFCAAIGNPAEPGAMPYKTREALVELAAATAQVGGMFGYHTYWPVHNGSSFWNNAAVTRDLPMRWKTFDDYFVARGISVKWMFGESGPCGSDPSGYWLNPWNGWRHPDVYNANINKVIDDLRIFDNLLYATQAYHQGRIVGHTLFTLNRDPKNWTYFRYETADMYAVCHYTCGNPSPPQIPPPPQPVWPVKLVDISRHQGNINWTLFRQECEVKGVRGLIIRCTLGVAGIDDRFFEYWNLARAQNYWDMSVYHLFRPEYEGQPQADHLLNTLENNGIELDFYPVFDAELDNGQPPEVITRKILGFYDQMYERAGYYPIQYTAAWWWNPHTLRGTGCNVDRCMPLHVAHYTTAPKPLLPIDWQPDKWFIWQYTSSERFQAVPQNTVDMNRFSGSVKEWESFLDKYQHEPVLPPCWGQPRVEYTRTVWVVPGHAANEIKVQIYMMAVKAGATCGSSYDDAGIGMLLDKTAVLWQIPHDQEQVFVDWYAEHYPYTKVVFRRLGDLSPSPSVKC